MRLKLISGFIFALGVFSSIACASQLTGVDAKANGNKTTLTIRADGAFTHTEYRPADNLLLVDLAGVAASNFDSQSRTLTGTPGVASYRITGYKGPSGTDTTRVELALAANAVVRVDDSKDAVAVHVTSDTSSAAADTIQANSSPATGKTVQIRSVNVARAKSGLNVEILASGAISPKVMKLIAPDRIVIDVPNATPAAKKHFAVHEDGVKGVRMARFQLNPPATRIVLDLAKPQEFTLSSNGSRATVALMDAAPAAPAAPAQTTTSQATAELALAEAAPVVIEPKVTTRPATPEDTNLSETPADRAASAASKFTRPITDVPVTNVSASMKSLPALTPAVVQQATQVPTVAAAASNSGCTGTRFTGEPISVNLKDVDLRDFFRLVHEISGLNVILDPKISGTLTLVLDDVPWDQALFIVMKNNSLDCQLEGNVLRIASTATLKKEADDRRAQVEAQALAVDPITINRYLSYAVAKDVVPTVKTFLTSRGTIMADDRSNSLIISDIPNVMPQVDKLIRELDQKTPEVEIEARVVAATRNFARDIGTQIAFGWGNGPTSVGGVGSVGQSPILAPPVPGVIQIGTPSTTLPAPPVSIPFFSNLGVAAPNSGIALTNSGANYRLDFILTAAESRGLVKILSRPRIVTQNNVQAVVRQGQRIPVVTGAQLGGPPTVTYVDAFLRLTVRPQITAENTIFLNVDVENTVPDFSRVTATQLNPVLITQQATTQVLVTDGGTVVIGGVIQTQSNVSVNQVPLLGSIPVLGELFKRRGISTSTQELIFFLTPKIIQT